MIKRIGKTIKILRENYGFTQKDLAEKMGVSDKAVSKWERGLSIPDVSYLRKLAMVLDTDADELLAGNLVLGENVWAGVLLFDDTYDSIYADEIVFDKPLIFILLSYFLLIRINTIAIIVSRKSYRIISKLLSNGKKYNLNILYYCIDDKNNLKKIKSDLSNFSNIMLLYKKYFIYGVGLSKYFQRAMTNVNNITVLSLPLFNGKLKDKIYFDENKKVVFDYKGKVAKEYNYYICPFVFFPIDKIFDVLKTDDFNNNLRDIAKIKELFTEIYCRGCFSLSINTKNDIKIMKDFFEIMHKSTGENIYDINEIYTRRKTISGGI